MARSMSLGNVPIHLDHDSVVVEQFVLRHCLVDDLLRTAEEEGSGRRRLRFVCPARHGNSVSTLVVVLHPTGLEIRVRSIESGLLRRIDEAWRRNRNLKIFRVMAELHRSPAVQVDKGSNCW